MISFIRKVLRNLLPPRTYTHCKNLYCKYLYDNWHQISYSQEGEDLLLNSFFEGNESVSGCYVDIGAHHPRRFSNTYFFYKKGWTGINIEPNPEMESLFRLRRPKDINLSLGVSDEAGVLRYFMFNEPALNSFDEKLSREREANASFSIVNVVNVEVLRLDRVLEQYLPKDRNIDFMTIDVEGHDFNVIKSNDWDKYRPAYLMVEMLGTTLSSIKCDPIFSYLSNKDYEVCAKTMRTTFFKDMKHGH